MKNMFLYTLELYEKKLKKKLLKKLRKNQL
jgi:hypothetical protein